MWRNVTVKVKDDFESDGTTKTSARTWVLFSDRLRYQQRHRAVGIVFSGILPHEEAREKALQFLKMRGGFYQQAQYRCPGEFVKVIEV
jgi:hypothetical protein